MFARCHSFLTHLRIYLRTSTLCFCAVGTYFHPLQSLKLLQLVHKLSDCHNIVNSFVALIMTTTTTTTTIATVATSGRKYQTSASLQTKRSAASAVTLSHEGFADSNEARYWTQKFGLGPSQYDAVKGKYAHPRRLKLATTRSAITQQVLFGPRLTSRHPPFAVVSGPRVNLYAAAATSGHSSFVRALNQSGKSMLLEEQDTVNTSVEPDRMVQTGGNLALCAAFRNDGRLLAVGTDAGETRICDVTMRSTLTTFSATKFPIRSLHWFRNGQHILAAGDDAIARIWDLGSTNKDKPILDLSGHGDVIRCAALWQRTESHDSEANKTVATQFSQLAVTGSYDHTVRVWNVESPSESSDDSRCLAVLNHGAPVEALCLVESDDHDVPLWLLSAGGTKIKVWNPLSGHCVHTISTFHRKTITSLLMVLRSNFEDDNPKEKRVSMRILSAGLDGVIQFHSWDARSGSMRHLYRTKLHESITSVAADSSGDRFAFGTVSGEVIFRMRGPSVVHKKRKNDPRAGTYAFFQRGMNATPTSGDYTVTSTTPQKRRKLNRWDAAMKKFRYAEALDEVLGTKNPKIIVGVLEELGRRRALTHGLSNRDEESLEPLLSFIIRNIRRPHFSSVLIGVAHKLIDIYGIIAGESDVVDELFKKLKHQIALECKNQQALMLLVGQIESF